MINIKKSFFAIVAATMLVLTGVGCAKEESSSKLDNSSAISSSSADKSDDSSDRASDKDFQEYKFTDSLGNEIVLEQRPETVVSLEGSYSEIWLLAGGELAGVTEDVISERNFLNEGDAKVIGSLTSVDVEQVIELAPDLVIVSSEQPAHEKVAKQLEDAGLTVAYFKVNFFDEYLSMLKICTDITGREDLYQTNGLDVQKQIDEVIAKVNDVEDKPSILFLRAFTKKAPAKKSDNMTGKMLADLGADNIAERHDSLLGDLNIEEVVSEDPDFIFVTTLGDQETVLNALDKRTNNDPAWNNLSAIKNDNYYVLPKDLFHYKPNARWGESYEYLAKILYPEVFEAE